MGDGWVKEVRARMRQRETKRYREKELNILKIFSKIKQKRLKIFYELNFFLLKKFKF